ncbi:MAG TPA: hypothetical protein VF796_12930 [Humisphaera sp.]
MGFRLQISDRGTRARRAARRAAPPGASRAKSRSFALLLALLPLLPGCIGNNLSRPVGQRVTDVPKESAEPVYFMKRSTVASVTAGDFDTLWEAVHRVSRDRGYRTDRDDPRLGVYTSRPLVSSQLFEPWRFNVGSLRALIEASLATVRRTVRWDVVKNDDGTFTATPRVLVERYTVIEHRVTSAAQFNEIFAVTREEARDQRLRALDPSAALLEPVPTAYWYGIGRDEDMEQTLADAVRGRV